jgi:membrane-bound ClpP family serine protease
MTLFGTSIETIYITLLIIAGSLTIIYLFFGDILEGIGEAVGFLNPVLILSFITFFAAAGYILELITPLHSMMIAAIAIVLAFILDTLLNVFILIPLSSAEESLSYTEASLRGKVGKIITPIPEDGFGEIIIESKFGMISKPATGIENEAIAEGRKVLVLKVEKGVLYVEPYDYNDLDA